MGHLCQNQIKKPMLANFYGQEPPAFLHHYTDAVALLGIVKQRELWATHIRYLNDAREFVHAIDLAKSYVAQQIQLGNAILLENLTYTLDSMPGNTFIVSFSEVSDLLSQWRGYCRSGGYSLEFDTASIKDLADQQRFALVKCTYDRAEQEQLIRTLVLEALTEFPDFNPGPPFPQDMSEQHRAHVFAGKWFFPKMQRLASAMKDPAFSEEREWRLIGGLWKPLPPLDVRPRGSLIVPYEIFKLHSDEQANFQGVIKRVIVGPNPDQEIAQFGVERLQQCGYIQEMRIDASKVPYRVT